MDEEVQNSTLSKNILLVIDDLGSGGAQNQITLLAKGLAERKFKVHLVNYYPSNFFSDRLVNVNHIYIEKTSRIGLNIIFGLRKILRQFNIDVVISFLDTPNFYVASSTLLNRKVKFFASYRSSVNIDTLSLFAKWKHRLIMSRADKLISNSHHERINWQAKYPQFAFKWKTIYNCVAIEDSEDSTIARKGYIIIGSVGPAKNGLIVLEALSKLNGHNIIIDWYGEHVFHIEERKQYLDQMNNYIQNKNLTQNFIWHKPIRNIHSHFNKYKALILASKTEGLPNVVCEAMMSGLPCIVSNTLDHPLLVDHGITGLLFEPDDADSLSNAIKTMETMSSDQYEKLVTASVQKAKQLFDYNIFLDEYECELK